jgi:hypothetical protein
MKRIITICASILMTASVFSQAPNKMSYQAVIRNSSNALVTNTSIGMRISILQTSSSGTAVYVETQTPTTNANGLASIEIGGGTIVNGNFANINWANGPYFIKTESDPSGGNNYTITGTSQLLSVPYSLYAGNGIPAGGLSGQVLTNCNGVPTWTTNGQCPNNPNLIIGSLFGGGVVGYIFQPGDNGFVSGETHGLIIAFNDEASGSWGCQGVQLGSSSGAIGDGPLNTSIIVNGCNDPGIPAFLCSNLVSNGYSDWFLPTVGELNQVFLNYNILNPILANNGGTPVGVAYWSSTEDGPDFAYYFAPGNAGPYTIGKIAPYAVRPFRIF